MSQSTLVLNEPLSPPRIGGIAAALAVHVAALMMLMAPMTYAPPLPVMEDVITIPDFEKPREIEPPKAPPIERKLEQKPVLVPVLQKQEKVMEDLTPPIIVENGEANDTPYVPPQTETVGEIFAPPSGPISLSTEYAPAPRYPALSLRNGEQGTVLLLVKVDATGKPIEVTLKKSSGYRELDKNAIKHVLATWRFHPAMHQGIAIPALALVPVNYSINE
jgi:periplasmic protein TonB